MNAAVKVALYETGLRAMFLRLHGAEASDAYRQWREQQWLDFSIERGRDPEAARTVTSWCKFREWMAERHPDTSEATEAPKVERCNGKVIFDKRGAQTSKKDREANGSGFLRIYECPRCKGWHLTSKPYNP